MRKRLIIAVLAMLFLCAHTRVFGVTVPPEEATPLPANKLVIPQSRKEHLAMAERYDEKAAQYRADADYHRKMREDYKRGVVRDPKSPTENPWIKEMRVHCDQYIKEADQLAAEASRFAEYHRMRAKELESK